MYADAPSDPSEAKEGRPRSPRAEILEQLEKQLMVLDENLTRLTEQLGPVLRPDHTERESVVGETLTAVETSSEHVVRLRSMMKRLADRNAQLDALMTRCEV